MNKIKVFYLLGALLCATPLLAYAIHRQLAKEKEYNEQLNKLYKDIEFDRYKAAKIHSKYLANNSKQLFKPHHKRGGSKYF